MAAEAQGVNARAGGKAQFYPVRGGGDRLHLRRRRALWLHHRARDVHEKRVGLLLHLVGQGRGYIENYPAEVGMDAGAQRHGHWQRRCGGEQEAAETKKQRPATAG